MTSPTKSSWPTRTFKNDKLKSTIYYEGEITNSYMADPAIFSATTTGPDTEKMKPYSDSFSTSDIIFNFETPELTVSIYEWMNEWMNE